MRLQRLLGHWKHTQMSKAKTTERRPVGRDDRVWQYGLVCGGWGQGRLRAQDPENGEASFPTNPVPLLPYRLSVGRFTRTFPKMLDESNFGMEWPPKLGFKFKKNATRIPATDQGMRPAGTTPPRLTG